MTDILKEIVDSLAALSKRVRNLETRGHPVSISDGSIAGKDHAILSNLDYLNSGHTGFEPERGLNDYFVTIEEKALIASISSLVVSDPSLYNGYSIVLYNRADDTIGYYASTYDGLTNALSVADSDALIILPNCSISGDFVIPAGVSIVGLDRTKCILTGMITLQTGCTLEKITINHSDDILGNVYGIYCSGTIYIYDCILSVSNSSGVAIGVYLDSADCRAENCIVYGSGFIGYAYCTQSSDLVIDGGIAYGSTSPIGGS